MDRRGRRRDARGEDRLAEKGVHEAGFAVVELPHDDEVEAIFLELLHQLTMVLEALGAEAARDRRAPAAPPSRPAYVREIP